MIVVGTELRVGFIGLGEQGGPMARRILESGFPMTVWARRREVLDQWSAIGAIGVETPRAAGERSDIVAICVGNDADVEQVMSGDDGVLAGAQPGTTVMLHSTVHPSTCDRLASVAGEQGVVVVDVPVSGSGTAAEQGNLVVLFGGDPADLARCLPVLESFADPIIHVGPRGSALIAKVLNNGVVIANQAIAREAMELGASLGIDGDRLMEVFRHASARSYALDVLTSAHLIGDRRAVTASIMRKDLALLRSLSAPTIAAEQGQHLADVAARMPAYLEFRPHDSPFENSDGEPGHAHR